MKFVFLALLAAVANWVSAATYYIDFVGGSNTATATQAQSKLTPWKRAPLMAGFSGTGYSHAAGDQFIFKGGVTWDDTCFPLDITSGGTNGNSDYYGVDLTWYTGGAWSRPIWDNGYVACTTHRVIGHADYITIDNIEMKRLMTSDITLSPALLSWYPQVGGLVKNCYIHGWKTSSSFDDAYGGFVVGTSTPPNDLVMDNTEIENSENIGIQRSGVCVRCVAVIRNGSRIHDNSSGVLFCLIFDGSYLYNISGDPFDGVYHTNGIYIYPSAFGLSSNSTGCYIRNSYLHDTYLGANMVYAQPADSNTVKMYNTICYGHMSDQTAVTIQTDQSSPYTGGTFSGYNNTIYIYDNTKPAFHVSTGFINLAVLNLYNNHVMNAGSFTDSSAGNTDIYNNGTNLSQSAATASSEGYTLGNLYAPINNTVGTYNTGTSESGTFTTDILGVSRPQFTTWDIGAYEFAGSVATFSSGLSGKVGLSGNVIIK